MQAADVCVDALRRGVTPWDIAVEQGLSLTEVLGLLDRAIGEDKLARSEIYFSVASDARDAVEQVALVGGLVSEGDSYVAARLLFKQLPQIPREVIQVCLRYGPAGRYYGDLYEIIRRFEIDLHTLIRDSLIDKFGNTQREWWYQGVPLNVRRGCAERAEELGRYDLDPWACTYMLDLQAVLKDNWAIFSGIYRVGDRNFILGQVKRINDVRNRVMHPVRDSPPTNADFDELRSAYGLLQVARDRFYGAETSAAKRAL